MTGTAWYRIRMALIVAAFATTLLQSLHVTAEEVERSHSFIRSHAATFGVFAVLSIAILPFMLLLVVGIQSNNPWSNEKWTLPSHESNPFDFGNPLLFFHFAAFGGMACGAAVMISSIWNGWLSLIPGLLAVVGSAMLLYGIRLCIRVYRNKFDSELPGDRFH